MTNLKNTNAFSSFSVHDLEETKRFYGQTLGLEISESEQGLNLLLKGGNEVFIYPKPDHSPATFTILNFIVDDVEQKVDELTKLGVSFQIYNKGELKTDNKGIFHGKPKIAWFKDPSGNFLSILENK
ncbi:MAG TPA: VOC family protein [Nitrososphaeraceae archaeon]|jgi:extradiol dioxygenase family protein